MTMIEKVWAKARRNLRAIVLPEGDEPRTVQAAAKVRMEGLAAPILLGDPDRIQAVAAKTGTDLTGIGIVNPADSAKLDAYADALYELRKAKGLSREDAGKLAARYTPPATCFARRCKSSKQSQASAWFPPVS